MTERKKTISIRNIPEDLWNRFLGQCHAKGQPAQARIVELVAEDIRTPDKKEQTR